MNNKCSCIVCRRQFSILGFPSHYSTVHTEEGKEKIKNAAKKGGNTFKQTMKKITSAKKEKYIKTPKHCLCCGKIIPYEKRANSFCNNSCVATHTNKSTKCKPWDNERKLKNKLRISSLNKNKSKRDQIEIIKIAYKNPEGDFCKIFYCNCRHCSSKFISNIGKWYCNNCEELYSHNGRAKYWFTFNIFNYPDLFDLDWLKQIGFRDSKLNPNGLTRDHKISVNATIKNQYDPYYIKHPLNCELMLFQDNNKKKTNCSITYDELIKLVDEYEIMVGGVGIEPTTGT